MEIDNPYNTLKGNPGVPSPPPPFSFPVLGQQMFWINCFRILYASFALIENHEKWQVPIRSGVSMGLNLSKGRHARDG